MDFSALITKMLIFIVLMVTGYLCARRGVLSPDFAKSASRLVLNLFMSATILNSVTAGGLDISNALIPTVMLVFTMTLVASFVLGAVAARLMKLNSDRDAVFELLCSLHNTMFIAVPVAQQLFGNIAVFYLSLSCIPFNLINFSYGVMRMKGGGESGFKLRDVLSMPLISAVVALVIFMLRIDVPMPLKELISSVSGGTMPLSMIVVGASLGSVSLADTFKEKSLYLVAFIKLIIQAIIGWYLAGLLTDDLVLRMTATINVASPSGILVTAFALQYDRDAVYSSEGILLTTMLGMLTLPLWVYILM